MPDATSLGPSPPRVSAVMTAYNSARWLQRAIDSLVTQTFTDIEIILVDDGSDKDDSWGIIAAAATRDPRIRAERIEHVGIAGASNRGLTLARGEYVARLDADDIALPDRFEKQVAWLDAHPKVAALGGWMVQIDVHHAPRRRCSRVCALERRRRWRRAGVEVVTKAPDAGQDLGPNSGPARFIQANTRLTAVPAVPEIRLYTAHPASGLGRHGKPGAEASAVSAPYWAFPWAGGIALARHILDRPETVAGRRIFDLGTGSGLVAIAAAMVRAREVIAADIDPYAIAALGLNATANGVSVTPIAADLTAGPPPSVDVMLVGDLFYEADLARRVTTFLERCAAVGITVLIGDPGRAHLPTRRLRAIRDYSVPDVGDARDVAPGRSTVFAFETNRDDGDPSVDPIVQNSRSA